MLALSAGGYHIAEIFGMMNQLLKTENGDWTTFAGNSAGALICAGLYQESDNVSRKTILKHLYNNMCHKSMTKGWSKFGKYVNVIHSIIFHNSLFRNLSTPLQEELNNNKLATKTDSNLYIGVYNITKGVYETKHNSSEIVKILCASSSVPGVFPPQRIGKDDYVDGGLAHILPTPAICDWVSKNKSDDPDAPILQCDIMSCYPVSKFSQFCTSEYKKSYVKMVNSVSVAAVSVLWNNLQRDIDVLTQCFGEDLRNVRQFRCGNINVRFFAPDTGVYSNLLSPDTTAMQTMYNNGETVVKNMINSKVKLRL